MDIDISLLGGFAVTVNGQPADLPTRKAAALLAVLAVRPGALVSRDRLLGLLWPDSPEMQARASLRQALSQLRRVLPDQALVTVGDQLRLDPGRAGSDVARLDTLLRLDDPVQGLAATELYRGRFLADLPLLGEPFEDWRRMEAERLHALLLARLHAWLTRLAEAGENVAALSLGEALVALDPLAEGAHRTLMRIHQRRGTPALAERQYQRCAEALLRELDVEPTPETQALLHARVPAPATPVPARTRLGIAVLPFANLSGDSTRDYLGEGLADDIIAALARFRPLAVPTPAATFALAARGLTPQEVAARLDCRFILTGSVRPLGAVTRVACALSDAVTGDQLWSDRIDTPPAELPRTQDDIVQQVAGALSVQINRHLLCQTSLCRPEQWQAHDFWLRGSYALRRGDPAGLLEARTLFRRAVDLDPGNGRAWSGLSLAYFNDWSCLAWDRWAENEAKALAHASRAMEIDPADHVAAFIMGRILLYRRRFEEAADLLDRAERLNPSDPDMLINVSPGVAYLGDPQRGMELAATAMRINPVHEPWYKVFASIAHIMAGDYERGLALGLAAPDRGVDVRAHLAVAHVMRGEMTEAADQAWRFVDHYQNHIVGGGQVDPADAVRWLFMVNPYRWRNHAALVADALSRAGLPVPPDAIDTRPPCAI